MSRVRVGDLVSWLDVAAAGQRFGEVTDRYPEHAAVRVRVIGRQPGEAPAIQVPLTHVTGHWRKARR